jgi:putative membrane protein
MFLLFRWIMTSLAILTVPYIVSGVTVADFRSALVAAAILAVLNVFVKPLLILLTLPLTFLTLGLFLLVINALLFEFAGSLVSGITISSFWSALGASLFVSTVSWLANSVGDRRLNVRVQRSAGAQRSARRERTLEMHRTQDGKWE